MPPNGIPTSAGQAAEAFKTFANGAFTPENAATVRNEIAKILINQNQGAATAYLPTDRQLGSLVADMRRTLGMPALPGSEYEVPSHIPDDYVPVPSDIPASQSCENSSQHAKWLPTPKNQESRQVLNAMVKDAFPSATAQQDGLKLFCKGGEATGLIAGEKFASGAALLAPKNQIQAALVALAVKLPTPELARAVALLQSALPAVLSGSEPALLAKVLQAWAQNPASAKLDIKQVLSSLIEIFHQTGTGSMPEVQQMLGQMIHDLGQLEGSGPSANISEALNQQVMALSHSGSPLLGGLKEMFGGNMWQGLNQILQPLMRALTGLFLTKPEAQFPKCIPDEKALAGLATLFAAQSRKSEKRKSKKKRGEKHSVFNFGDPVPQPETQEDEENCETIRERVPAFA